jgi:hypothetical protein
MRVVANEKYIARRALLGRVFGWAGLAVLFGAIVLSFVWDQAGSAPLIQLALWGALAVGVMLSFLGGYLGDRFGGPLAHHAGVRAALKGLDHRHVLLQYVLPSPHVLLGPDGLTVIAVRSQPGRVTYAEGRWTHQQRRKFLRELAGQERLGRPDLDAGGQVQRMTDYLEQRMPGAEVPVRGVVLFTHPDVSLEVQDPPVPVFFGKKLKPWLRGPGSGKPLPAHLRGQLEEQVVACQPDQRE